MQNRSHLRKEAYRYIQERLCNLPAGSNNSECSITFSLHELNALREGAADPSVPMVAALKELFCDGVVTEDEIDMHLVIPFRNKQDEV